MGAEKCPNPRCVDGWIARDSDGSKWRCRYPVHGQEPRGWVQRLGSYLRIFGFGDPGQPEGRAYLDRMTEKAKLSEAEFGKK